MDQDSRIGLDGRPARPPLLPGGMGLLVSMTLHAAALPLLLSHTWSTAPTEAASERVIEISLAWAPPPAGLDEPRKTPPTGEIRRQTAPAAGPTVPPRRRAAAQPARIPVSSEGQPPPQPAAAAGGPAPQPPEASARGSTQVAALPDAAPPPPPRGEVLAGYARLLQQRLNRFKTYPALSERRGEEGVVTLRLTVTGDGRLIEAMPVGEAPGRLVAASLAAVRAASPFPPLPAELGAVDVVFDLPIAYRLH